MKRLIFLSYILVLNVFAQTQMLDKETMDLVYQDAKKLAEILVERCPPKTCHVIALGRSPTVVSTYMKAIDPRLVTNLPLSRFRYNPHLVGEENIYQTTYGALIEKNEKKLFNNFDEMIQPLTKKFDQFLIIDYSVSGRSAFAAQAYLEKYFKVKGIKVPKMETGLFVKSGIDQKTLGIHARGYKVDYPYLINTEKEIPTLHQLMHKAHTDRFAEYHSYSVDSKADRPRVNDLDLRFQFMEEMHERVLADPALGPLEEFKCNGMMVNYRQLRLF